MGKLFTQFVILGASIIFFTNCAVSLHDQGKSFLKSNQYDQAIKVFRIEVETESGNYKLWRDLGIAYFKKGAQDSALSSLEKANRLNTKDGATIYYLGAIYEKRKDYAQAIHYYRQYTKVGRLKSIRKKIKERLKSSIRESYRNEIRQAIKNESRPNAIPDSTIAVLHFENRSGKRQLNPLEKGFAELVSYYLSKIKALRVLERVRLQVVLEELKLAKKENIDKKTAPRVGRLLGAKTLVKGSFVDLDNSHNIRIDAGLVNTQTGELKTSDEVTGRLNNLVRLQKNIVRNLLDELNIPLTEEEFESFKAPTDDRLAFMAFSEGLQLEDEGRFEEALGKYNDALSRDPNFGIASDRVRDVTTELQESVRRIGKLESEIYPEIMSSEDQHTKDRMSASGAQVNAGIVPGQDERDSIREVSGEEGFGDVPVKVEIPIRP